jgi:hypothetical protein
MTAVRSIKVTLVTGKGPPRPGDAPDHFTGGSNGQSFLFIGGREFRVNQKGVDDKKPGGQDTITLGEIAAGEERTATEDADFNDPRKPYPLVYEEIDKYPIWLRFEPVDASDNWLLDRAKVEVFAAGTQQSKSFEILRGEKPQVWLGKRSGLYVSLAPLRPSVPPPTPTPVEP